MTTAEELLIDLVDYYHEWIDGDDIVEHVTYDKSEKGVQAMFEDGKIFWITAEDIT